MASIKRNFAYSAAYQILNIAVPLVTTPYLSRTIGADGNGIFTYTQSIVNYFVLFAQLGITNYGVREIARCGIDREERSRTFWEIFAMNLFWGALVVVFYFWYAFSFGTEFFQLLMIWLFWVVGSVMDVTWLLNGCQEFRIPMVRNACTRLGGMALIFLFVHAESDVWAYVAAIAAPYFVNALFVWLFVSRYVDCYKPTCRGVLSHVKPNLMLFIPVIAVSLYTLLDKVLLGVMAGMEQVGYYDYAEKISKMPLAVVTALGAVVLPKMTEVISAGRRDEAIELVHETMWFMEAVAMGLAFGVMAIATEFVPVFFGDGYDECVQLMCLLSIIIPLICATNVIGVQYLVPFGRDLHYTGSVLIGATVNIAINVFAIPNYGAVATAVATVAAELAVLAAQVWLVRDELRLVESAVSTIPFVVCGAIMVVVVRCFSGLLGMFASTIPGLCIETVSGALIYVVLAITWCLVSKNAYFYRLFGQWIAFCKPKD